MAANPPTALPQQQAHYNAANAASFIADFSALTREDVIRILLDQTRELRILPPTHLLEVADRLAAMSDVNLKALCTTPSLRDYCQGLLAITSASATPASQSQPLSSQPAVATSQPPPSQPVAQTLAQVVSSGKRQRDAGTAQPGPSAPTAPTDNANFHLHVPKLFIPAPLLTIVPNPKFVAINRNWALHPSYVGAMKFDHKVDTYDSLVFWAPQTLLRAIPVSCACFVVAGTQYTWVFCVPPTTDAQKKYVADSPAFASSKFAFAAASKSMLKSVDVAKLLEARTNKHPYVCYSAFDERVVTTTSLTKDGVWLDKHTSRDPKLWTRISVRPGTSVERHVELARAYQLKTRTDVVVGLGQLYVHTPNAQLIHVVESYVIASKAPQARPLPAANAPAPSAQPTVDPLPTRVTFVSELVMDEQLMVACVAACKIGTNWRLVSTTADGFTLALPPEQAQRLDGVTIENLIVISVEYWGRQGPPVPAALSVASTQPAPPETAVAGM